MEGQVGKINAGPLIAEPPVFASGRGPKGKLAVRLGILALIALITVWLTALILGAIGFGNLPDMHLPGARGSHSDKAIASPGPAGLAGVLTANGVASGGGFTTTGSPGGSSGSRPAGTPGSPGSGSSGTGTGTGSGRGTPTGSTSGGRGAPDTTPSGKNTPGNGHGKGKGLTK